MIPLLGKTLNNRYRIEEHIGRGGMAEVYRAFDQQRGVYLALKVLREDLAEDAVFIRRFEREAKTLAALQHPNIVRFYGFERSDGYVYMLMEFIEGKTLRKIISERSTPFSEKEVFDILDPVCRALHFAHQSGRVHCDVKSANILIKEDGHVYLTDFGIARGMDMATSTMVGIGTPAYMAPELIKGEDPSPQADIYALGIMLYEMLTGGERPFTGERASITGTAAEKIRWEHLKLAPIPPSHYNPNISPQMEYVILRCLSKEKEKRFKSTMDLIVALKSVNPLQFEKLNNEIKQEISKSDQKQSSTWIKWAIAFIIGLVLLIMIIIWPESNYDNNNAFNESKNVIQTTASFEPIKTHVPTRVPTKMPTKTSEPIIRQYNIVNPYAMLTVRTGPSVHYPTSFYLRGSVYFWVYGKDETGNWLAIESDDGSGWVAWDSLADTLNRRYPGYFENLTVIKNTEAIPTSRPGPTLGPYER
ncbi:MAG: protein kinase [Anaerolineaceae bacterium]